LGVSIGNQITTPQLSIYDSTRNSMDESYHDLSKSASITRDQNGLKIFKGNHNLIEKVAPSDGRYVQRSKRHKNATEDEELIRKFTNAPIPMETKTIKIEPSKHKLPQKITPAINFDFEDLL
jgi:hypothetical protein